MPWHGLLFSVQCKNVVVAGGGNLEIVGCADFHGTQLLYLTLSCHIIIRVNLNCVVVPVPPETGTVLLVMCAAIRKADQFIDIHLVFRSGGLVNTATIENGLKTNGAGCEQATGVVLYLIISSTDGVADEVVTKAGGIAKPFAGSAKNEQEYT